MHLRTEFSAEPLSSDRFHLSHGRSNSQIQFSLFTESFLGSRILKSFEKSEWDLRENNFCKKLAVFFSFYKTKVLHFPECTAPKSRQQAGAFYQVRRFLQPWEIKQSMTTWCSSRVQVSVWRRFDKLDHWCLTKAACTLRRHIWCCCRECGDGESSANFEEIM